MVISTCVEDSHEHEVAGIQALGGLPTYAAQGPLGNALPPIVMVLPTYAVVGATEEMLCIFTNGEISNSKHSNRL